MSKQHFEYTDINPASGIPLGAPGQAFQPLKWSLAAQYELPLPTGATLTPRLDFVYNSGFFTNANADPQSYNPGYHELNARITYKPEGGKWEAALLGKNLGNKLWYTSVFDLYASSGALYGMPSEPTDGRGAVQAELLKGCRGGWLARDRHEPAAREQPGRNAGARHATPLLTRRSIEWHRHRSRYSDR